MDNLIFSINAVLPLFVLVAIGYALRTFKILDADFFKGVGPFVFVLVLPVSLFRSVFNAGGLKDVDGLYVLFVVAAIVIIFAVSFLTVPLFVKERGRAGATIQAIFRSNFLVMGFSLAARVCGDATAAQIGVLMAVIIPLYNILAVIILSIYSDKISIKDVNFGRVCVDIIKNPLIISCFAAILLSTMHVRLPSVVDSVLDDVSSLATPMSLILLGGQITLGGLKKNIVPVMVTTFVKLVIVPLSVLAVALLVGYRGTQLFGLVTIFATPTAVTSFIMAQNMDCDSEIAAQYVVSTTALSVVTLFLFIFAVKNLGLV